ncbi:hypothetical protein Tco_0752421 [Tanacetum coccineum]|uniref:Uncharacterized protein n=1 Tax=Tanacetum coccineum TaxID=301880 RepID=A0ABQ4Z7T0_9ASTR
MEKKDTLSSCSESEEQQMQLSQDKSKESCMVSFRQLHSHLKRLLNNDLKGSRTEDGFKRAFMTLFCQDLETFTGTMFLNMDQLEKQLDNKEFQEIGSMASFKISTLYMKSQRLRYKYIPNNNVSAKGQQHTEQPEFINEGEINQNAEQCHDTCPFPAKLTDDKTIELSNQLLESENVPDLVLGGEPTGRKFSRLFCLDGVPTYNLIRARARAASTTKVDSGPPYGVKEDITNHVKATSLLMLCRYSLKYSSDLAPQRQEMSVENVSLGLVPQGQKASDYDNSDPVPPRQNVVPYSRKDRFVTSRIQFLGDKLVSWMSKKQNYTAMSSAEAEYVRYLPGVPHNVDEDTASRLWLQLQQNTVVL